MKLLEELRNLDVGDPGQWSARVSVMLACVLFLLLAILGLRLRVFGQLAPRLEHARLDAAELDRQLAAARNDVLKLQALGEKAGQAEALLKASGVRIPSLAREVDLPVSLAARQDRTPLQAVRPWEPQREVSRQLRQVGAELDLSGSYRELVAYLEFALESAQLRELAELSIESQGPEEPGRLRATARMVSYFGGEGAERLVRTLPEEPASLPDPDFPTKYANLPSPFSFSLPAAPAALATHPEKGPVALRERGHIQVGERRYRLVEDARGKVGLRSAE